MALPDPHITTGWPETGSGGGRPPGRFGLALRVLAIVFLVGWFGWLGWLIVAALGR